MLEGFLDFHRETLLWKCAGLTPDQLRPAAGPVDQPVPARPGPPPGRVERSWFRQDVAGEDAPALFYTEAEPDRDIDPPPDADPEADLAAFRAEVEACRAAARDRDAGQHLRHADRPDAISLRWVYVHMIEEYARHNGHADLIRQAIDGATGE